MTKGNSLSGVLFFCGLRADCLKSKVTSDKKLYICFFGYPRASRRRLKLARHSSNVVFEEFVLSQSFCFAFSIVGLYFKGTCDVISSTMATNKVHKSVL